MVGNSLYPIKWSMHCELTVECTRHKAQKLLDSKTSPTRWKIGKSKQLCTNDLLLHLFPTVSTLTNGQLSTRINKIQTSRKNSTLSEVNLSPRCINTIGYILLDYMVDFPVWSTVISHHITSNITPNTMTIFILVTRPL